MKKITTKQPVSHNHPVSAAKVLMASAMICLLLFLTCVNFFLYSPNQQKDKAPVVAMQAPGNEDDQASCTDNPNPAGPDEKSPNSSVGITEEYIHHQDEHLDPFCLDELCEHKIAEAGKLTIVHFELLSPPPEA